MKYRSKYKVSIITVSFNSASTIEDTILSVASQSYPNVEHVVIDGGSSDRTLEIIQKHKDKISKYISESDNGIYDALNKGIQISSGEIIGVLHSDDVYFDTQCISEVVRQFEESHVQAVCGDLVYVSRNDKNKIVRYYKSSNFKPYMFSFGIMPAHPSFFVKKECYNVLGLYKPDYLISADFELLVRFLYTHRIQHCFLDKVLTRMRIGGTSTKGFKSNWRINQEIIRACKENGIKTNYFRVYSKYFLKIFQLIKRPTY